MADFSKPALAAVEALVFAQWAEIGAQFRVNQAAWYNWRDRVAQGDLTPPFAVVSVFSEAPTDQWGPANKTYNLSMAVYYVRSTDLTAGEIAGGAAKVEDLIYPKCSTFRDALIAYATTPSGPLFQLVDDPAISLGVDNPANDYLVVNADKFWAGEVSFTILCGETYR